MLLHFLPSTQVQCSLTAEGTCVVSSEHTPACLHWSYSRKIKVFSDAVLLILALLPQRSSSPDLQRASGGGGMLLRPSQPTELRQRLWVSVPAAEGEVITDAAPRSAPEADVAHGLACGAALCRGEVDLAAGADTHLVHGLVLGGLAGRRRVDTQREVPQLNGVGI